MKIERPKSKQPIPENAQRVFKGVIFDVYHWEQEMYDGTTATFEKLKRADTVVVFPVLSDAQIVLTEQEQPGMNPFFSALGGRVEEGENIITAVKRELLEESGYEAEEFVLVDARHPTSKIDGVIYTFIAKGLKKVAEIDLDGGEKIKLFSVTFDEFIDLLTDEKKDFADKEMIFKCFEARIDSKKKEELKELFRPIENK